MRQRLPDRRRSIQFKRKTYETNRTIHITVGFFVDDTPGEIFVATAKEGQEMQNLMHALAMMISLALQHGCPAEAIVEALKHFSHKEVPHHVAMALQEAIELMADVRKSAVVP